jgi:hypothetical protein
MELKTVRLGALVPGEAAMATSIPVVMIRHKVPWTAPLASRM